MQICLLAAGLIEWLVVVPAVSRWNQARVDDVGEGYVQGADNQEFARMSAHQVGGLDGAMSRFKEARARGEQSGEPSEGAVFGKVGDRSIGFDEAPVKVEKKRVDMEWQRGAVSAARLSATVPPLEHIPLMQASW